MAGIRESIALQDAFSAPMMRVIHSVETGVAAIQQLQATVAAPADTAAFEEIRAQLGLTELHAQQLNGTLGEIRAPDAGGQQRFNEALAAGNGQADRLLGRILGFVGAYASFQGAGKFLAIADSMSQTTARLGMMNDGMQSTQALMDDVFAAAQRSRGSFADMAAVVAKFGNNAREAFGSSAEVVRFAETVQKQMKLAGASGAEASNAILQLSQALGSGVLRGDELNSIFEQAPNLIRTIAEYLHVPVGSIREMASEGLITADIVRDAMLGAADEIDRQFEALPMTWGDVWQSLQNTALKQFLPVFDRLSELASSDAVAQFAAGAETALKAAASAALFLVDLMAGAAGFIAENWSVIGPIVYGLIGALALCVAWLGAVRIAAMLACPTVWIVAGIAAVIAAVILLSQYTAEATGAAQTGFGVITGGINVVIQYFLLLGQTVANIALGIWNAFCACAQNLGAAFYNAISGVQGWFFGLLSTALTVVARICEALNRLPFVEFDYSGITGMAANYAAKSAEAAGDRLDYADVGDAFSQGMGTFDGFGPGWVQDAFRDGAAWGDGVLTRLTGGLSRTTEAPASEASAVFGGDLTDAGGTPYTGGTGGTLGDIAADTAGIRGALDASREDLRYLRDIAEAEAINRFTTAEIKIEQINTNNISGRADLDGILTGLTDLVEEAVSSIAKGAHL